MWNSSFQRMQVTKSPLGSINLFNAALESQLAGAVERNNLKSSRVPEMTSLDMGWRGARPLFYTAPPSMRRAGLTRHIVLGHLLKAHDLTNHSGPLISGHSLAHVETGDAIPKQCFITHRSMFKQFCFKYFDGSGRIVVYACRS